MDSNIYTGYCRDIRQRQPSVSFQYAAVPAYTSELATRVGGRTSEINAAFMRLKDGVIQRGVQYAGNTVSSRGGFMAENFVAESFNLDAVLKNIDTPAATVPGETGLASPDIVYDGGKASLKFYRDAESSGKAQLNPEYGDQNRIVPADQLEDAKATINRLADRNELKGRTEAAKEQRAVAEKITDRIHDENGIESTPLTKQQDLDMAQAVGRDADGNVTVDEAAIDQVMKDTGISGRVRETKLRNEITGLGTAVAIGLGTGITMSLVSGLARVGLDSEKIGDVVFDSLAAGTESGTITAVTYAAGRGATHLMEEAGMDLLSASGSMANFAAIGILSTSIVCVYQFTKSRIGGASVDEALDLTGKTAL
ncbi:MAG: hypothetical protein HDT27_04975, partial [Subdoligranulum sp.]|nr:hypothetical protein [Subdoligranulum sp.]